MRIQDMIDDAIARSSLDACVVVGSERTTSNLRFAANSLTTNGQMTDQSLTMISIADGCRGLILENRVCHRVFEGGGRRISAGCVVIGCHQGEQRLHGLGVQRIDRLFEQRGGHELIHRFDAAVGDLSDHEVAAATPQACQRLRKRPIAAGKSHLERPAGSAARRSVGLTISPRNIASRLASTPAASASATRRPIVRASTRCFEKSNRRSSRTT